MAKLSNEKKREIAERYYINEGWSPEQIASQLDVSARTVYTWKKGRKGEMDWDTRRANLMASPHKIKEVLIKEMEMVASGEKGTVNADALLKLSKVFDSLSGKTNTQIVISVLMELDNWMAEQDPEMAVAMLEYHKQFILYKAAIE